VETSYLFESSQTDESRAYSADSSKAYSKLIPFNSTNHQSKNLTMWYKTPWFCRAVEFFVLLVASTHYVAKTMTHLNVPLPQCVGI